MMFPLGTHRPGQSVLHCIIIIIIIIIIISSSSSSNSGILLLLLVVVVVVVVVGRAVCDKKLSISYFSLNGVILKIFV